jgi:hypothetical protein
MAATAVAAPMPPLTIGMIGVAVNAEVPVPNK